MVDFKYESPGHTPGSVSILFREDRILFTGDSCNPLVYLFLPESASVAEYKKNLIDLKKRTAGKFDKVMLSHGLPFISVNIIDGVLRVCDDILSGNTDDIPHAFVVEDPGFIAKAIKEDYTRVDGGLGNIVYNKNKIC